MTSYEFRAGESVPHAVQRMARHELDAMIQLLRAAPRARKAVHAARKHSKKLRALLRLVRDEIGERTFWRENRQLRDVGRVLSPLRDAEVLVQTLASLGRQFTGQRLRALFRRLDNALRARRRETVASLHATSIRRAIGDLVGMRSRVGAWSIRHRGWSALAPGLRRIDAHARAASRAATTADDARLHELRKRVKDMQYVLKLAEPIWPPVMKAFAEAGDRLIDCLGEDHDLARLASLVVEQPSWFHTPAEQAALLARIGVRRRELQAEAVVHSNRQFGEKPRALVLRLGNCWKIWRAGVAGQVRAASLAPARG